MSRTVQALAVTLQDAWSLPLHRPPPKDPPDRCERGRRQIKVPKCHLRILAARDKAHQALGVWLPLMRPAGQHRM